MKKTILMLTTLAFMIACGNNTDKQSEQTTGTDTATGSGQTATQPAAAADPEADRGLELIGKSDCLTCHKVAEPFTGPAYEAIAAKYPDNQAVIDSLAGKVIKGGSGNWGTIPMTPHPDISEADAKAMVKYVLSLK